ncbi:MAG TPA: hypothetical protein VNU97_10980 [Rhizomicrobium sp.]|jgi:hypothetical protein|nr:hypothetical protein [Rhizomicrobium sp.]
MVVRLGLGFVGLFHVANGLAMLVFPERWAALVVHLGAPDHLHLHFIADIAMAFLASGAGLLLAARRGAGNALWAVAGAAWPLLHALIHLKDWLGDGLPATLQGVLSEGMGVILVGALGVFLAWRRVREGDA